MGDCHFAGLGRMLELPVVADRLNVILMRIIMRVKRLLFTLLSGAGGICLEKPLATNN